MEIAPKGSEKAKVMNYAALCHVAPFILWIAVMLLAQMMHLTAGSGDGETESLNLISDAGMYTVRTALCVVALFILRPWRWYAALRAKNIVPAVIVGLAVFILWVGFETQFFKSFAPRMAEWYETYCVKPFGAMRPPAEENHYAPEFCGWTLAVMRLLGSAFVIAVIEEFFWRGYLLRTIKTPDFLDLDVGYYNPKIFFIVALIFGMQHNEFAVATLTGVIYGYFYLITRDIWAVSIAHVTTNLVLGIYVLCTGYWHFW